MDQWPFVVADDGRVHPVDGSDFDRFRRGLGTLGAVLAEAQTVARVAEVVVEQSRAACLVRRVSYHRYELTPVGTWSAQHRDRVLSDQCEVSEGAESGDDAQVLSLMPRLALARLREHAVWRPTIEDVRALAHAIQARAGRRVRSAPVGSPRGSARPEPTF